MKLKTKNNRFLKITFLFLLAIFVGFLLAKTQVQKNEIETGQSMQPKIEVSGVKVNDFIKGGREESFITIDKTKDYHVFYIPAQELFYISITSYPFEEHIVNAENSLLEKLGITEEEACKLNVDVTTPAYANTEKAGVVYGLSFCSP